MVRHKFKVDCVDGQWVIVVAKGAKAGKVIKIFSSSDDAWVYYNKMEN